MHRRCGRWPHFTFFLFGISGFFFWGRLLVRCPSSCCGPCGQCSSDAASSTVRNLASYPLNVLLPHRCLTFPLARLPLLARSTPPPSSSLSLASRETKHLPFFSTLRFAQLFHLNLLPSSPHTPTSSSSECLASLHSLSLPRRASIPSLSRHFFCLRPVAC